MSTLNLVPNPSVMAIQAGIFLLNAYAVKKLLLEPYLEVYKKRNELTKGSQESAERLESENSKALASVQDRIQKALADGRGVKETILAKAKKERDELIETASTQARATVDSLKKEIEGELSEQRKKIPEVVNQLSRQLVDALIPV